jgi:hypothetical protein
VDRLAADGARALIGAGDILDDLGCDVDDATGAGYLRFSGAKLAVAVAGGLSPVADVQVLSGASAKP